MTWFGQRGDQVRLERLTDIPAEEVEDIVRLYRATPGYRKHIIVPQDLRSGKFTLQVLLEDNS